MTSLETYYTHSRSQSQVWLYDSDRRPSRWFMRRAVPVTSMTDQERIHAADVSEGIGGDATAQFEAFRPPEGLCNIT
jgi:hypothetical protein